MSRVGIIQPSFVAGELTPRLYGRVDFNRYSQGAECIENYVVRPEGGIMRRHGTRFGGEVKTSSKKTILVPFVVSTIQPYMLEFGDLYIRFWKNNAPIASITRGITAATRTNPVTITVSGGNLTNGQRIVITGVGGMGQLNNREFTVSGSGATVSLAGIDGTAYDAYTAGGSAIVPLEVASPYLEADLDTLFFTQSADTLYIVHGSYAPRTLVRATDTSWSLVLTNLSKGPWAILNTDPDKDVTVTGGFDPGDNATITSNVDLFEAGHAGSYMYLEEIHFADRDVTPYGEDRANNVNAAVGDQYSNDGKVYECIQAVGGNLSGQVPPTHEVGEAWDSPKGATSKALFRYLHSRWCVVSLDAFVNSKQMTGKAVTVIPTSLNQTNKQITGAIAGSGGVIRLTSNGHNFSNGDWVNVNGVGGVPNATGNWKIQNADTNTFELVGSVFAGAFTSGGTAKRYGTYLYRLGAFSNARGWPRTVAIHEQRLCYANTNLQPFGFWASMAGDYLNHLPGKSEDDEAIMYNIAGNQVDPVRWLMSANQIVLGTLSGELAAYGGGLGDPITPGNTRIVPQSGEGSNATLPTKAGGSILFSNRAGRKLFAVDYRAEFDQYVAEDMSEIASHLTVGRTIVRLAWAKNPMSALWVLFSDGLLASMTFRPDQKIAAWARHPITNGFVESIAVIPNQGGGIDELWMVVRRTINGVTKRYIEYLASPFEPTSPTDKNAMGFVDSALSYNGAAVSALSGLFHLEGQTVQVVANGATHPDRVVTGGKITLQAPATNVWAGLGYVSRLRTLRMEQAAQVTAQGKVRRIPRVTVRVMNSLGGKVGDGDEKVMDELVPRAQNNPMNASTPLYTGDKDVTISTDFGLDGRISITQSDPMPLDVLALMPMMSVSEG